MDDTNPSGSPVSAPSGPPISPQQGGRGGTSMLLVGAVIVIIVIALGVVFVLTSPQSSGTAQSGNSGTTTFTTTTTVNSSGSLTSTKTGGGPGGIYLSESQAASLIGPGGTYNATYPTSQAQFIQELSTYDNGTYERGIYANNITGLWAVVYSANNTNGGAGGLLAEVVLQSTNPKFIYSQLLKNTTAEGTVNVTNATVNGFTYTYAGTNSSSFLNLAGLVGYKGSYIVTMFEFLGANATAPSYQNLSSTIAGDLP